MIEGYFWPARVSQIRILGRERLLQPSPSGLLDQFGFTGGDRNQPRQDHWRSFDATDGKGFRHIPRADRDHGRGQTAREEGAFGTDHLPMQRAGPAARHLAGYLKQQAGRPSRVIVAWYVHEQLLVPCPAGGQVEMMPRQPDGHQSRDPIERDVGTKPRDLNALRCRIVASASTRHEPEERLQVFNQLSHLAIIPDWASTKPPLPVAKA
jgi:hypothetical protein